MLCLCVGLCACDSADYKEAQSVYMAGHYQEAHDLFVALGDYEDSTQMAKKCSYMLGCEQMEKGEYAQAMEIFQALGDYEDSSEMIEKCQIAEIDALLQGTWTSVQYKVIMDDDAEDFDYVINNDDYKNLKIDLETFIVDVETGEARELEDFNYVIGGLVTRESMVRGSDVADAEDYFKFENLIILIPIAQNRLDDSERAIDMRVMTDKGELKKSVKFVDFQTADIPSQISEELFTVRLLSGQVAITKEDGTVLHKLDKSYRIVDQYIVGTQAIYDFDLNKVYDLRANKATVMGIIENTVYINAETDNGYNVIAFRGGETKTLYTFNAESPSGNVFELIEDAHCYMIFNAGSGEFSYYNSEDERITNTDEILTVRYASERHSTYLMWTASALEPSYCLFVGAAE